MLLQDNRDFRIHDPLRAQILVTVPDILSIMLLSVGLRFGSMDSMMSFILKPSIANVWTPRLKLIILDEIHCRFSTSPNLGC